MFRIYDGRKEFYQWDLDRKLIVDDDNIKEVHFCNRTTECALPVATYKEGELTLVNVPNLILQESFRMNVYAYDGEYTKHAARFEIVPRSKPDTYVYTETEIKTWDELCERIDQIEQNGISDAKIEESIQKYLEENNINVDLTGYATEDFVRQEIEKIEFPETDLTGYATEKYVDEAIQNIDIPEVEQVDEVYVGKSAPTDENVKIWVDTDAESPVATKEYVQQKIAEAQMDGADVDLSSYYTKTETDEAIEEAVGAIEIPEVDLSEYAKKSEIPSTTGLATEQYVQDEIGKIEHPTTDLSDYYTKSETDKAISDAVGAIEIPEAGEVDLSNYYTKSEVDAKIPDVSGYQTAEEVQSAITEALNAIGVAEEVSF